MKPSLSALLGLLALTSCDRTDPRVGPSRTDLGTGLNTVSRTYPFGADTVFDAGVRVVEANGLKVESKHHDALGGEIIARRATGEKASLKIRGLESARSEASFRIDPGDRSLALLLHDRLLQELTSTSPVPAPAPRGGAPD
jgi:hypothetical protein